MSREGKGGKVSMVLLGVLLVVVVVTLLVTLMVLLRKEALQRDSAPPAPLWDPPEGYGAEGGDGAAVDRADHYSEEHDGASHQATPQPSRPHYTACTHMCT